MAPATSACDPFREVIESGLALGRNAMAIWQDLGADCGFTSGYQSVKRFVRRLRGSQTPPARAVIVTAPGEDYGGRRVMLRSAVASTLGQHATSLPGTKRFP